MTTSTLDRLAQSCDIQLSYSDLSGAEVIARPETVLAALRAMRVIEEAADVPDALKRRERERWRWHIEPVTVAWGRRGDAEGRTTPVAVTVRLPESAIGGSANLYIELEDGGIIERALRLDRAGVLDSAKVDGERCLALSVRLPPLPYGYHKLCVEAGGKQMRSWLIAAPVKAFATSQGPSWGVFLPLYAMHSKRSWGIGDYTDLRRLIEWAGAKRAGFVATLPLLPACLDTPFVPSPYEPVSRLFWNEVFVDPEAPLPGGSIPNVDQALAEQARALLESPQVDYEAVMRLKRRALEAQAKAIDLHTPAGNDLDDYLARRPDVRTYASFRAAMERLGPDWREWPASQREGKIGAADYDAEVARYYEYAQWRAHTQMHAAVDTATALGMRSYLDLPVGVLPQGYDAWCYQDVFAAGMSVGAPPDLLSTNGQNWGFQPLISEAQRRSGYEYLARYLRHYFASAKMLRIDHAIGLHRLYWIPEGATGRDGVFVRQPAEELYAVLCLESMRCEAVVVAEDLGLVPPEVGGGLKRHGIGGMYVQMFEMTGRANAPLRPPKPNAVASFSTHDLPPFAAYWQDDDLKQREALGLLTPDRVAEEQHGRSRDRKALVSHLTRRGLVQDASDIGQVFRGSTALLAESPAQWVVLNIEDAWAETRAQNLPGTTGEQHPNWVSRAAYGLDEFDSVEGLTKAIETIKLYRPVDNKAAAPHPKEGARAS